MRIAHVVSTFPPYRGGMGNVAAEIATRTAARGHEAAVVTPRRIGNQESRIKNQEFSDSKFQILHSRPWLRFGNAAWCLGIARTLEELQPDLVHFHWPFIGGLAAVLRWRRQDAERRLVVQYHMDLIGSGWRGAVFASYQRRALPRLLAIADRIVVSSLDYACNGALASYGAELGDRLIEIPLGVDVGRFTLPARGSSDRSSCSGLFVGGLDRAHAFKGVDVLLRAVAQVPDVRLRIVGDGDLRTSYERQARSLGIADRVEFLGSVSDADLPGIYQDADVLVLPSTARSEAFGVVLLEAMASGVPVMTSDLPGVRTVVADGVTGFLVPPGDVRALAGRLSEFVRNPNRVAEMGTSARARVLERYQWNAIAQRWLRVYESACTS